MTGPVAPTVGSAKALTFFALKCQWKRFDDLAMIVITLYQEIIPGDAELVLSQLRADPKAAVEVRVNSPGGSVVEGCDLQRIEVAPASRDPHFEPSGGTRSSEHHGQSHCSRHGRASQRGRGRAKVQQCASNPQGNAARCGERSDTGAHQPARAARPHGGGLPVATEAYAAMARFPLSARPSASRQRLPRLPRAAPTLRRFAARTFRVEQHLSR